MASCAVLSSDNCEIDVSSPYECLIPVWFADPLCTHRISQSNGASVADKNVIDQTALPKFRIKKLVYLLSIWYGA